MTNEDKTYTVIKNAKAAYKTACMDDGDAIEAAHELLGAIAACATTQPRLNDYDSMMLDRRTDKPTPGYFRIRRVAGGPWVGARISHGPPRDPETGERLDRSWFWSIEIDGELAHPPHPEPFTAGIGWVWMTGTPITEQEYRFLLDTARYARQHDPAAPEANPREKVNLGAMAPIKP